MSKHEICGWMPLSNNILRLYNWRIFEHVGTALATQTDFFNLSCSVFGLDHNSSIGVYKDNICFFCNVICAKEMKKIPLNFKPQKIKQADVKILYDTLRTSMPELPYNCKHFQGFNDSQLDTACQKLKINGYIF